MPQSCSFCQQILGYMSEVPPKHGRDHRFYVDLMAVAGWLEKGETYSAHGDFNTVKKSPSRNPRVYNRGV